MPRLSVIISSYNHGPFIEQAIRSVLAQSMSDFELIINDDGSTDNSADIIRTFSDPRIKATFFEKNRGACASTNNALERCSGEYLALLNSDDFFLPGKLQRQVEFLDNNTNVAACFGLPVFVDEHGREIAPEHCFMGRIFETPNKTRAEWLRHFFFRGNCLCHPTIMVRRSAYERIGYFDERYAQLPDFDMWIRLVAAFDIHVLAERLIGFRILKGERNASANTPKNQLRSAFELGKIRQRFVKIPESLFDDAFMVDLERLNIQKTESVVDKLYRIALSLNDEAMQRLALDLAFEAVGSQSENSKLDAIIGSREVHALTGSVDYYGLAAKAKLRALADGILSVNVLRGRTEHESGADSPMPVRSEAPLHIHLASMAPQFLDVRTALPLHELSKAPLTTVSTSLQRIELPRLAVEQPKVLVIQRIGVPEVEAYKKSIRTIVERGWVIVAELDDHPELLNAVHGRPPNDAMWHSLKLAHAVQTSTPALAEAFRPHNSNVAIFSNAAFRLGPSPRQRRPGEALRVFFGALNRERFSSRIGAALAGLAAQRKDLRFVVVHDKAFFDALGSANKEFHPALTYERFLSMMESCDIALMPLEGGPGERYKSDVKFVEASSLGLATLASPVVYGGTILDGVTGVIVPDVGGWAAALEALASDRERLLRIALAAHAYVGRQRLFSAQIDDRLAWYRHLWAERIALTRTLSGRFTAA